MENIVQFNALLTNQLDQQVADFFTNQEFDQCAQQIQFTQRMVNKLSGSTFFKLIVFIIYISIYSIIYTRGIRRIYKTTSRCSSP
jgi:hypothetical protein